MKIIEQVEQGNSDLLSEREIYWQNKLLVENSLFFHLFLDYWNNIAHNTILCNFVFIAPVCVDKHKCLKKSKALGLEKFVWPGAALHLGLV